MITVRQMERWWDANDYGRMARELLASRVENSPQMRQACGGASGAAALAMIRLDELDQSHVALRERLLQRVLRTQEADGGWGDPLVTAVVLQALLSGHGAGAAVDGAIGYLVRLQQEQGSWPAEPLRRMPADVFVTAFIVHALADCLAFEQAARMNAAMEYLEEHAGAEPLARQVCERMRRHGGTLVMN